VALEQESHLMRNFEARERDIKVQKDGIISDLQAKIRQLEGKGKIINVNYIHSVNIALIYFASAEKSPEVNRLLSTAKLKFDSKEQELRRQFMQEMAQRDKLLREKAEKVKVLNK